ncbi:unnamed protein product [Nezara viridula]|uniref:Uncharacterized protein n=1 Tax=Nezara viridula TaxID=85310 RepID=A0A9P0H5A2_NEZVI|nr:unnamed protein product [Nezara viridula]
MIGFKARRQELRIGTSDIPLSKTRGSNVTTLQTVPVSEYGLNQGHGVLLEGVTYPPNLKSMMAQSLGPMTSVIMLSRSAGGIYSNKWEEAVTRDFMNFPDISQCVALIKGNSPSASRQLFRVMADILLITGSRCANRMFFPGFCLISALLHTDTIASVLNADENNGVLSTITVTASEIKWEEELSFSGTMGFEIYQKVADCTWSLNTPSTCNDPEW